MRRLRNFILFVLLLLVVVAISSMLVRFIPIFKPSPKPKMIEPNQIRLEIINASGIDKAGKRAMVHLRKLGFDVYGIKTGQKEIAKTTIVDRVNPAMRNAQTLARALAQRQRIIFFLPWYRELIPAITCDIDSTLYLEASVILGKDCQRFIPKTAIAF